MILMLLCAKTARTYGRGIFQYVDLTAPNVAAGKNTFCLAERRHQDEGRPVQKLLEEREFTSGIEYNLPKD